MLPVEFCTVSLLINVFGMCALFTNIDMFLTNRRKKEKSNIIITYFAIINVFLIVLSYPLIIISNAQKEWLFATVGCTYYGFLALFLGFAQMHVPILMVLDAYFCQSDPQYDANKNEKRKKIILISFLISLFWGSVPLFGYPKMTFEPSQVSCSVFEAKPGMDYIVYIVFCLFFFEIIPLAIFGYCKANMKDEQKPTNRPLISIIVLIIAWTPLTIVYVWPFFGSSDNLPYRISLWAPPFAKLTALILPLVFNE